MELNNISIFLVLLDINDYFKQAMEEVMKLLMFKLFVVLLRGVRNMNNAFDVLAGVSPVEYRGEPMSIYDFFFTKSPVYNIFWGITLIGVILAVMFSIVQVGRKATDLKVEKTMGATLGQIGRSMLMFLVTPIMVLAVMQISAITMKKTSEMFYIANKGVSIDTALFMLSAQNATLTDPLVTEKFGRGLMSYENLEQVRDSFNINAIKTWIGIPVTFMMIVVFALCLILLSLRLFMMIVLYIVSPLFISSMVIDDGRLYKGWREVFLGKTVAGMSMIISVEIFTFVIVPILIGDIALVRDMDLDIALKCFLGAGSAYAMYKSTNTLAKIVAPRAESENALVKIVLAATFGKALKMTKNAAKLGTAAVKLSMGDVSSVKDLQAVAEKAPGASSAVKEVKGTIDDASGVAQSSAKIGMNVVGGSIQSVTSLNPVQTAVIAAQTAGKVAVEAGKIGQIAAKNVKKVVSKVAGAAGVDVPLSGEDIAQSVMQNADEATKGGKDGKSGSESVGNKKVEGSKLTGDDKSSKGSAGNTKQAGGAKQAGNTKGGAKQAGRTHKVAKNPPKLKVNK